MSKFGNRIRQMRVKRCMTQQELARLVGLEKAAVSKYETGRITDITKESAKKFANALGTTPEYLCGFTDSYEQPRKRPFDEMLLEAYHDSGDIIQAAIRVLLNIEDFEKERKTVIQVRITECGTNDHQPQPFEGDQKQVY